ncbi:MAG: purine-binding chemotaxis protein CheW, partial [Deltaproteobacteria bacterium]|nr:purine-binding chemotaxis protein CheW [Deltaproteobacteria bacterium]
MKSSYQLLVFSLDGRHYGIQLSAVERVVRAVELISVPEAPELVSGLINVQGRIIPVLNIRQRFHLPNRDMTLTDRIIISTTSKRTIAFLVDEVLGVFQLPPESIKEGRGIFPKLENYLEGVGKINNEAMLIYDLNKLFAASEDYNPSSIQEHLQGQ